MFPQRHSISGSGLDQMLQLTYSAPMPLPTTPMDRSSSRWKPNIELAPNCPRCASINTKFCYYNNYSLSQPRYFCKGCRRYWTKGGSLRNVPVGGGCRKNRRGKSARQSQNERLSLNSFHGNSGCDDRESSSAGDGDQHSETNGSRDIDMALVFAKFLNQKPSSREEFESVGNNGSSSSNNLSTSLTTESVEAENDAVIQPPKPSDPTIDHFDALLLGGVPVEETIENFAGEELSLSGIDELEGFLGVGADEDVVKDALWSDATTMSSSVTWEPPMMQMQLQELECWMPLNEDGQLLPINSTMNLISDSWSTWSSFELSTMEVFSSRP